MRTRTFQTANNNDHQLTRFSIHFLWPSPSWSSKWTLTTRFRHWSSVYIVPPS